MNKKKFDLEVTRISYILNNACNLYCKHCFQNADNRHSIQLSIEDALKATEFVIKHNKSNSKNIEITLIGGEPTLYNNFKQLKKCFELLFDNNYTIKIFRIFTNGTIYSEELMELLNFISKKGYKDKINFYITKDFLEDKPTRINIYGNSMNKIIDDNINLIKNKGYNVILQYIFSKDDVENYSRILNEIYKNKEVHVDYGYPCEQKKDLNENDFNYMIDTFFEFIKQKKVDFDFYKRSGMELLYYIINDIKFYADINNDTIRCNPIKGEFSISPKGYIIPCVKLLEKENEFSHLTIENISKNPDLLFKNKQILNIINYEDINEDGKKCEECIFSNYCHHCRLFPTLININQDKHIEHHRQQCERIFTFCSCILNKIKEYK